jgi:transcriptional regulator with XRE-family HTH domain
MVVVVILLGKTEDPLYVRVITITSYDNKKIMNQFKRAKKRIEVSVGESVRVLRELQGLSQNELASRTKIAQSTISAIENDRVKLGVERAKSLARALRCHPAVLVSPGREIEEDAEDLAAFHARRKEKSISFKEASKALPAGRHR